MLMRRELDQIKQQMQTLTLKAPIWPAAQDTFNQLTVQIN